MVFSGGGDHPPGNNFEGWKMEYLKVPLDFKSIDFT
jgi:hypothetical protein